MTSKPSTAPTHVSIAGPSVGSSHDRLFDLNCAEAQENLSAMLDGELGITEEAAIRRHVEGCQNCITYEQDLLALTHSISQLPERVGDGAAAWARAKVQITSQTVDASTGVTGTNWVSVKQWAAAAVFALAVTFGGWQILTPSKEDGAIIAETARDFQVFQASGEVLDISATHPDAVSNWMTARLDFMLPGQLRAPEGTRITGGRLCSLLGRKLAFIAYSVQDQDVGLYVAKADGLDIPADGSASALKSIDGLTTIGWRTGDLAYVIVSDLPVAALSDFSTHFQRA